MSKKILAVILTLCLMLALAACGGSEPAATEDTQPSGDATTTTTTEASTAPTAPTPAEGQVLYTIKVVDGDGNPLSGKAVQMCNDEGCDFKVTDEAGCAYFCKVESEWKVAFSESPEIYYYFDEGSYEMTLNYELASATDPTEPSTEPSTNDIEFGEW